MPDEVQSAIQTEVTPDSQTGVDGPTAPDDFQDREVTTYGTVDGTVHDAPAEAIKTEDEQETKDEETPGEGGEPDGWKPDEQPDLSGDDTRFDKHPRFQKLIQDRDEAREARIRAEAERDYLKQQSEAKPRGETPAETKPDFINILDMSDDDLREQMDSNPKGLMANLLRQAKVELEEDLTGKFDERETNRAIASTFENYAKENTSFDDMWKRGEIQAYMKANPGHNAISAHMVLTREAQEKSKIEAAVKEAVEKERRNFRQKKETTVLPQGPQTAPTEIDVDAELKDTKAHGGFVNLMTKRIQQMRANK